MSTVGLAAHDVKPKVEIRPLSFANQACGLYWLGDLMSLNPIPSTIDSEPPPHQMKPNPLTPQMGEGQCSNTRI